MRQTTIPIQPFGIGDIIFTQTLMHHLAQGNNIVWPVFPQFVEQLNRAYPNISFVDYDLFGWNIDWIVKAKENPKYQVKELEQFGCKLYPIFLANERIMKRPYTECMRNKYDLYNLPWQDWKDKAMWQRSPEKEYHLYHEVLGLKDGEEFNLINNTFGSDSKLKVNIKLDNGLKTIEMKPITGYSLFDWAYVLERATNIHTVSSSIIYILEMINLVAEEIAIYVRKQIEKNHDNYSYILQKHKYILK